jgi:hypothetical protein
MEKGGDIRGNYYYSADKFAIYDISTTSDPIRLYLSEESYQDVEILDNFAYVLGTSSITIYDISDKRMPVIVNSLDIWAPYTIIDTQLVISGHLLYLLTEHNGLFVRAYDISNPLDIVLLDTLDTDFVRDSGDPQVKIDSLTQNYVLSFIDNSDDKGMIALIDISDPSDLTVSSSIDTNIVGGMGCITTSFGYIYGSYVDTGANKVKIYDIINHFDPRLIVTKDISGSYPINSMDIFENSLYINRQTATNTYTFEVYTLASRTNPVYKCAVSVDTVGEIMVSPYIILVSGASKTDILQIHYSNGGINSQFKDGQVVGNGGSFNFQAASQGIFGLDFICPATWGSGTITLGDGTSSITLRKVWSANWLSKDFHETPDYNTFDFYDTNFDLWGGTGVAKIVEIPNSPIGSKAYLFDNSQRSVGTYLSWATNWYIESLICLEKVSGTTGSYFIDLGWVSYSYNPSTQKWYSSINGELESTAIPTAMNYHTWKITYDGSCVFEFYLDDVLIDCAENYMFGLDPFDHVGSITYGDSTAGSDSKMWLAGYRTWVWEPIYDIIEDGLHPDSMNSLKIWFDCLTHKAALFLNGELKDIYNINEKLDYINQVSCSMLMDNVFWTPLDEDLDRDGLTSTYESLNSLSDMDTDTDDDGMPDGWEVTNGLNPSIDDSTGDLDGDLVYNIDEYTAGTSANCADSDHDSMPDKWEITYGLNPNSPNDAQLDSDSDGIINIIEFCSSRIYTTALNPKSTDSDSDTMPDGYEMFWRFDPSSALDKEQDADGDYLQNYLERTAGTNPRNKDTDNDGMWDKWELDNDFDPLWSLDAELDDDWDDFNTVLDPDFEFHNVDEFLFALDPHDWDTDDDNLPDGYEVFMATHEEYDDGDFDYMDDTWEIFYGFRPYSSVNSPSSLPWNDGPQDDNDSDGLTNYEECNVYHTNPIVADTDEDGLSDGWETCYGYNPLSKHSDTDGLEDGYEVLTLGTSGIYVDSEEDGAGDGLLDNEEVALGTEPMNKDTDDDGLWDGAEVHTYYTDPLDPDTDSDGLFDGTEVDGHQYWDPFKQGGAGYITVYTLPADMDGDTDNDGLKDGEELGITEYDYNSGDVYYYDTPLYFATLGTPDNYPTSHGNLAVRRTNPNDLDSDNDGASDGTVGIHEYDASNPNDKHFWTDPLATDTDGDTLGGSAYSDYFEMHGWDIHYDSNSDNILDAWLYGVTSNPRKIDSDGDNIGDLYEYNNGYTPSNADWDGDGLTDNKELLYNGPYYHLNNDQAIWTSNPWDADTDNDGLSDGQEFNGPSGHTSWYSNPNTAHSDDDGLTDYQEYFGTFLSCGYISNPRAKHTDYDEWNDRIEEVFGTDPASVYSIPVSSWVAEAATTCTLVNGDSTYVTGGGNTHDAIAIYGGSTQDLKDGWPGYVHQMRYKFTTYTYPSVFVGNIERQAYISDIGINVWFQGACGSAVTVKNLKITQWSNSQSETATIAQTFSKNTWYLKGASWSSGSTCVSNAQNNMPITQIQLELTMDIGFPWTYSCFFVTDQLVLIYGITKQ